jgi:hypothetical protein
MDGDCQNRSRMPERRRAAAKLAVARERRVTSRHYIILPRLSAFAKFGHYHILGSALANAIRQKNWRKEDGGKENGRQASKRNWGTLINTD